MKIGWLILLLGVISSVSYAQTAIPVPLDSLHWNIQAKEKTTEEFQGQKCLKLVDGAA